jgi:radical SAM protein with 4Fe4S-binding SPASM domain
VKKRLLPEFVRSGSWKRPKDDAARNVSAHVETIQQPPPLFCSAPWLEATIRINGDVFPCCRSKCQFGSLETESLAEAWVSSSAQRFRRSIRKGLFPDEHCEACFRAGTHSTLSSTFSAALGQFWARLSAAFDAAGRTAPDTLCKAFSNFHGLVDKADPTEFRPQDISKTLQALLDVRERNSSAAENLILKKLERAVTASKDYVKGEERPGVVATFRQVNLVSVCNARCIHCLGNVNQEITRGTKIRGKRHKYMRRQLYSEAMKNRDDVTRFYMNGSELFLYKNFENLLRECNLEQICFSISTNGMLLTPEKVEALLDSRCLSSINISFDGANRKTVESIRRGVRYSTLLKNTRHFLHELDKRSIRLPVSISMVLLRENIDEAARLVQLVSRLRDAMTIDLHVNFQLLEHSPAREYVTFRERHGCDMNDARTLAQLAKAAQVADELGVEVYYGPNEQLCHALERVAA